MDGEEKTIVKTTLAANSTCSDTSTEELSLAKPNYTLKLDLRLIPILGCTFTILFLDRTNSELPIHICDSRSSN